MPIAQFEDELARVAVEDAQGTFVPRSALKGLLSALYGADESSISNQDLCQAIVGLNASESAMVDVRRLRTWAKSQTDRGAGYTKNRLLIKPQVGTGKASSYGLPAEQTRYGRVNLKMKEGAGAVVLNWVPGRQSKEKGLGMDIIKMNRMALSQGALTAKAQAEYRSKPENVKIMTRRSGKKKVAGTKVSKDLTFGRVTQASIPVGELISSYQDGETPDRDYPDLSKKQTKGRLPLPRPTKASKALEKSNKTVVEDKEPFKINKFKRCEAKVHSY